MISAVDVLCVSCGCHVSIVVCTCECLALDHTDFVGLQPLTSVEVKTRTIF